MKRHIRWLYRELDGWVHEGVIEDHHAQAIRQRYPAPEDGMSWGRMTFGVIGSVMIGLGAILFFAFNWSGMHKFVKLAVIFSALLACHGAALFVRRNALRETLHVLGTMLFGAGIWLVAQIYHLDEHYPDGILLWGCGALALAWALPSISQAVLAALLLLLWQGFEALQFRAPLPFAPALVLLGTVMLALQLRSRVLLSVGLTAFHVSLFFMIKLGSLSLLFFLSLAALLIAAGLVLEKGSRAPELAPVFSFFGYVPFSVIFFLLTFSGVIRDLSYHSSQWQIGAWMLAFTIGATGLWIEALRPFGDLKERYARDQQYPRLIVPVVFALSVLIGLRVINTYGGLPRLAYNLLFLAYAVLLMLQGFRTGRTRSAVVGCILLAAFTVARYTDLFHSLLARSAVFFIIGALMIGAGYFFTRKGKAREEAAP